MFDAERHRIRRKFIRVCYKIQRSESCISDPRRPRCQRIDDLMANALATIATARSLIVRSGLAVLRLPLLAMRAAIGKKIETVSRQNEQGDDGEEEFGAQETQGRHW